MSKIALVGLGLVGRAWAISFARAGHEVALFDERPEAIGEALSFANRVLPELDARGLLHGEAPLSVRGRMRRAGSLEEALEGAAHVQESTPEDVDLKRQVFARLDLAAEAEAVLASSTSAILPSLFTETLKGRARCLVAHPINPPYLIPAVELVPSPWTDAGALERTRALLTAAGHAPIAMKREIDGFVVNRLQGALLEEAFRLVAEGVAGVEDVDVALREGLALTMVVHGPVRDDRSQRAGRRARLCGALRAGLREDLSLDAMAGRLVGTDHGRDRGGAPRPPPGRAAGRARRLARPPPDGARRPQAAGGG